jgi:ribonuclease inhibitor
MKEITIDCRGFVPRSDLHKAFADALSFPDHYGNNLDALHDCLTDISEETRLHLLNWADAEENLGNYARSTKRAILEAAIENKKLAVTFD